MCLGMKPVVVPQFTLYPAYVLLQVAAVDNSRRFQIGFGLSDFPHKNLSLIHILTTLICYILLDKSKFVCYTCVAGKGKGGRDNESETGVDGYDSFIDFLFMCMFRRRIGSNRNH